MAAPWTVVTLCLIGTALAGTFKSHLPFNEPLKINTREVSENLYIDNAYHDAGEWGNIDLCEDGSFAAAIEINYQEPGFLEDETAINAIKLYCKSPEGHDTGYVTSSAGEKGDWYGMQICSTDFITGFRANVLEYQGVFTDDVAVEDFEVDCNYGREIIDALPVDVPKKLNKLSPIDVQMKANNLSPANFGEGEWSSFTTCREGSAVCGVQTRYEDGSLGDEAAIVDVVFFCCERPEL